jgi:2-haloacid dehalogenase
MAIRHVFFDVNETLTDFKFLQSSMSELGLSPVEVDLWFSRVLRDGFALTLTEQTKSFAQIGVDVLTNLLRERGLSASEESINQVVKQLTSLPPHPDVESCIRELTQMNISVSTLSNGSTAAAEFIFDQLKIRPLISHVLSLQETSKWKPHIDAYQFALKAIATNGSASTKDSSIISASESALVACHPWDTHGAHQAGMKTVWVNRGKANYPSYFSQPTAIITSLSELPSIIAKL